MVDYRSSAKMTTLNPSQTNIDQGLRTHMLSVYNYMFGGLCLTGLVAFAFYNLMTTDAGELNNLGMKIFASPLVYVVMFAPLGMVFFLSLRINKMSFQAAQLSYWTYTVLMGLLFSSIGIIYTGNSILSAILVTAITFGAMSLWGYTTKRDLTAMGSFAIMAVIGIMIATIVNIFLESEMVSFIISYVAIIAFTLLTAYDTQKIREIYFELSDDADSLARASILGALNLYIDFINIFISILNLFGTRD